MLALFGICLHLERQEPFPRTVNKVKAARQFAVGLTLAAVLLGFAPPAGAAATLSMRESILLQQRDRATIQFSATIGPIGTVHSISADCDIHVPIITQVLFLAVLGEIKNACSMGPTKAQLVALGPGPMTVRGAFRIWFEGHDSGIPFREEDMSIPDAYENSGPPHLVEVHPITRLGNLDLLDRVRFVEKNGVTFAWKTGDSFRRAATRQMTIAKQTVGGHTYVQMVCSCPALANHYELDVEIVYAPHPTDNGDGVVASGRVFHEDGSVILSRVRFFAIAGTSAAGVLETVDPGDRLILHALARVSLRPLLRRATFTPRQIPLPIELVVLHAEVQ